MLAITASSWQDIATIRLPESAPVLRNTKALNSWNEDNPRDGTDLSALVSQALVSGEGPVAFDGELRIRVDDTTPLWSSDEQSVAAASLNDLYRNAFVEDIETRLAGGGGGGGSQGCSEVGGFPLHRALLTQESNNEQPILLVSAMEAPRLLLSAYGYGKHAANCRRRLLAMLKNKSPTGDVYLRCTDLDDNNEYGGEGEAKGPAENTSAAMHAHKFLLAHRSEYFRALFVHHPSVSATEEQCCIVDLPRPCTPRLLQLLLPYLYTMHATELENLLEGCGREGLLVQLAYVASSLLLPDLKDAACQVCADRCVDSANAPSLLHVAEQLEHASLKAKCVGHMVRNLVQVQRESPFFESLVTDSMRANLAKLSDAAASNPLCCGADLTDAREFLGMLRETLDEQRMRYADAVERQKLALAEARAGVVRSHAEVRQREARLEIVSANLEKQRVHLESFHHFLKAQESIFFHKHDEDSSADFDATAATAASSSAAIFSQSSVSSQGAKGTEAGENIEARGFVPSFEWQNIPRGVSIPAGLEIRLNLSSGAEERAAEDVGQSSSPSSRMARIPPCWHCRLWCQDVVVGAGKNETKTLHRCRDATNGAEVGCFTRINITRASTVSDIITSVSSTMGLNGANEDQIAIVLRAAPDDAESSSWFRLRTTSVAGTQLDNHMRCDETFFRLYQERRFEVLVLRHDSNGPAALPCSLKELLLLQNK